jgi:hypothetical protein
MGAIFNEKIEIPKDLQNNVVHWYHNQLCHPGMSWTELSIKNTSFGKI